MNIEHKIKTIFKRFYEIDPEPNRPPEKTRQGSEYKSLVSVVLSAQTQDKRTALASKQLFNKIKTPQELLELSHEELVELIRPVGMYNNKAKSIRKMAEYLITNHEGKVPNTRAELMKIPGVGRKSTDIMMRFVFDSDAIAVDTHVRRICYRLGVSDKNEANHIADILEKYTPQEYKWGAHERLIEYGKQVCSSRKPKCSFCIFNDLCSKKGVINFQ